jgi:YVTN family beta-propeller protein
MKTSLIKLKLLGVTLTMMLLATSCENEKLTPDVQANNLKGLFVVCEGNMNSLDGDLTHYDAALNIATPGLFSSVNNKPLGDVLQNFAIVDSLGFFVVNNSQKIEIVTMRNFKQLKTINNLSYPRNILQVNDKKIYVSNGNGTSDNKIYVIDRATLTITKSIAVGKGPEKMVIANNKVYVTNSGGWETDNTVMEIDPTTDEVTATIPVGQVPVDMVVDKLNNLWVYCKGIADYSNWPNVTYSESALCKITLKDKQVKSWALTNIKTNGINNLAINKFGTTLYYTTDGIYKMDILATELPASKFIDKVFYGLESDPINENIIGLSDTESKAYIYQKDATPLTTFATGLFPNSVIFSY